MTASAPPKAPMYRYCNGKEHFYTTSAAEIGTTTAGMKGKYGYNCEGIACYVSAAKVNGYISLYRYLSGTEHFYTTNAFEIGTDVAGVTGKYGYKCEGIAGWVAQTQQSNTIPLYRYCNGKEHFYTTNAQEIGTVTAGVKGKCGYTSEGVACYVWASQ